MSTKGSITWSSWMNFRNTTSLDLLLLCSWLQQLFCFFVVTAFNLLETFIASPLAYLHHSSIAVLQHHAQNLSCLQSNFRHTCWSLISGSETVESLLAQGHECPWWFYKELHLPLSGCCWSNERSSHDGKPICLCFTEALLFPMTALISLCTE